MNYTNSISRYNTPLQRTTNYSWLNGMAILSVTDADNGVSEQYQYDNAGRKTAEYYFVNGTVQSSLARIYDDQNNKVTVKKDIKAYNDQKLQTVIHYDQAGRKILEQYSDGTPITGASDGIKNKTIYQHFSGGSRVITSSPYRTLPDPTLQWQCTQYDQAGRVTVTATFNNNSNALNPPANCTSATNRTGMTQISYAADWIAITDPTGKIRKERRDALGRLAEVIEDPTGLNYVTTYTYDLLDNLLTTTQSGQIRSFTYSSLGRLISTTTPESGTTSFTYYDSGQVLRQTDARGKWSEATYDALHRITARTYSDATPAVTYTYYQSGAKPQVGQLKSVSSNVGTTTYTYDKFGNVAVSEQTITDYSTTLHFLYEWYLGGSLKSITLNRPGFSGEQVS